MHPLRAKEALGIKDQPCPYHHESEIENRNNVEIEKQEHVHVTPIFNKYEGGKLKTV